MGMTVGCLPRFIACMLHSGTIKAISQEVALRSIPATGSLGSASEVYGVFSNRGLFSTSGG